LRSELLLGLTLGCAACRFGSSDANLGYTALPAGGGAPAVEPCASRWEEPVPIPELNTPDANCGGHISPDGLTYYFDTQVQGNWELFITSRADEGSPFAMPEPLSELNTPSGETDPSTTPDDLELYFTSDRDGPTCIYWSQRARRGDAWGPAQRLDALCDVPVVGPSISGDGLTLYYNTSEATFSVGTVMVSTRATRGEAFTTRSPVPTLTRRDIAFGYPSLAPDGLSLFVSVDVNELDIWMTTRPSLQALFGEPSSVDELNGPTIDGDPSVVAGGTQLIFASARAGSVDLYLTRRVCSEP
jgi:Tol biopolymer transport system component